MWKAKKIFFEREKMSAQKFFKTLNGGVLLTQDAAFEMEEVAERTQDFKPQGTLSNLVLLGVSVILITFPLDKVDNSKENK